MSSTAVDDPLVAARAALERHEWHDAFELFKRADAQSPLEPDDLEALGQAAWWAAEVDESIAARERAYAAYVERGSTRRAGYVALDLMGDHGRRLEMSIAATWYKRAERLLAEDPDCAEHGYLVLNQARAASSEAELDTAAELAGTAVELGTKFGDRDLQAYGLTEQGMTLVARGDVAEGLSLVDEATMAAVSGELSSMATGSCTA